MTESNVIPSQMDIQQICETIPHRYPFLLVDRVLEISEEELRIVAIKNITMNEPQFTGHYPGQPVMPGVLLIEAMAQAAAVFLLSLPQNAGKVPFFASVDGVKFRRQVTPGDQLRIEVQVLRLKKKIAKAAAKGLVDGEVAVEAELTCMLAEAPA